MTEKKLGRLKSFGLAYPWQVAFLLPNGWEDLRKSYPSFVEMQNANEGEHGIIQCVVAGKPSVSWKSKQPMLKFYLRDRHGNEVGCNAFGDTREFEKELMAHMTTPCHFRGRISKLDGHKLWLSDPEIITEGWVGKVRPIYPGKTRVISPKTVRDRVFSLLQHSIPTAAQWLVRTLEFYGDRRTLEQFCGLPDNVSLAKLIYYCHLPINPEHGQRAHDKLMRLACLGVLREVQENKYGGAAPSIDTYGASVYRSKELEQKAGWRLNQEQNLAICEIAEDLASLISAKRLLSGDVGSGKTAVYGTAAAGLADSGGRSVIILPNTNLSQQIFAEMSEWWTDIPMRLVTAQGDIGPQDAAITLGTTALLFDDIEKQKDRPDLLVIDEQQKFSREQRERIMGPATRLLEVSATPIPRSFALLKYGALKVSKLPARAGRELPTRLWAHQDRAELFTRVKDTLAKGQQVLVVYPQKEETESENQSGAPKLQDLKTAVALWSKVFPGQVVCAHGGDKDQAQESLRKMKANESKILLATTVIECGITIPNLHHEVIVHPDRLGLVTLHQLRGRLARMGGVGLCDLYTPNPIKEKTLNRLQIFCSTVDGFKLAELDLKLRGMGDLSTDSELQSGADQTFMFGKNLDMSIMSEVLEEVAGTRTSLPQPKPIMRNPSPAVCEAPGPQMA